MGGLGDFFKKLVGAGVGFVTGGPVGAGLSLVGSILGGGEQAATQQPVLSRSVYSGPSDTQREGFWRGLADRMSEAMVPEQATVFNPQAAMEIPTGLPTYANQQGGMVSPQASMQPGWNRADERWPRSAQGKGEGRGDGKGAGAAGFTRTFRRPGFNAGSTRTIRQPELAAGFTPTVSRPDLTSGFMAAYDQYMQRALLGQGGLPESAYQAARMRGVQGINAQTQQARSSLAQQMAQRGITGSGVQAQGLMGIEGARTGAVGQLEYGLAQQGLQAARETQQAAAKQLPMLYGIEESAAERATREYAALKQLELYAQQLGMKKNQLWQALESGLGEAGGSYLSRRSAGTATPVPATPVPATPIYDDPLLWVSRP